MKSTLMALVLTVFSTCAFSQALFNLLRQSEESVKDSMEKNGVYFVGKNYTKQGQAFLHYQYSLTQVESNGGILDVAYYMDDKSSIKEIVYLYGSDKDLDEVVKGFTNSPNLTKISNFKYMDSSNKLSVEIERDSVQGFTVDIRSYL